MHMYSTCLFCNRPLGENEAIEEFPVGRRLAFDPDRGRLWVVCRRCERWNLSPLDIRWEAVEACERRYRDARMRVSTDNIGLARLSEGLELVRIGRAQRPEFAAWRYGDQFGRRRRRALVYSTAGAAAMGAVVVGGSMAGGGLIGSWWGLHTLYESWKKERTVARLRDPSGRPIRIQQKHLLETRLLPADTSLGWTLEVAHARGWSRGSSDAVERMRIEGDPALRVAGQLMARVNRRGGRRGVIDDAVRRIQDAGHPETFLREAARESERLRAAGATALREKRRRGRSRASHTRKGSIEALPTELSLAIEMATQEEAEREAMRGELAVLEAAWRAAEEIAAIADDLLVPDSVRDFLRGERRDVRREDEGSPAAGP